MRPARRVAVAAALVALGAGLHVIESMIPAPLPLPGAKLGLANLSALLALVLAGPGLAVAVALSRPLVGGLVGGSMFSMGFFLALGGAVASVAVMSGLHHLTRSSRGLTPVGLSMAGGVAHNMGQLAVASFYVGPAAAAAYLGPLILAGLVAGYVIGRLADRVSRSTAAPLIAGACAPQSDGRVAFRPRGENAGCSVASVSGK